MAKQFIFVLFLLTGCLSKPSSDIEITAKKNAIIFNNWNSNAFEGSIFVLDNNNQKIPLEGTFYKKQSDLVFTPEFPLLENAQYLVTHNNIEKQFSLSTIKREPPVVTTIYPSSNILPENLLRMYIQFSNPMKTSGNIENIKLLNQEGQEVKGAIFNNVYELWDKTQTQLTIIFDPSRVKTGLIANQRLGRALQPRKSYKLVIDNLQDIYGQSLNSTYTKTFNVVLHDVTAPDTNSWKIELPKAKSLNPFTIRFSSSLDMMSLLTRIQILDSNERFIKGKINISNQEKTWLFIPNNPWKKGDYTIKVNSRLEDPSGNNLNGLFDHKIGSLKSNEEGKIVKIPVKIH